MGGDSYWRLLRAFVAVLAIGFLFPPAALAQESGTVVEVVDGDTLRVRSGREVRTVRLIGIDAPERSHPSKPEEFLADESSGHLASLCDGKTVRMEADREDVDRYGRLLRYVFLSAPDGRLVNKEMVRQGYARFYRRFPFSRQAEFQEAEGEARREGKGVWREGGMAEARWMLERRVSGVDVPPRPAGRSLPAGVVSWEEAHRHVGREVVVEGTLVRTHRARRVLHLNFHPNWNKYLTVVILGKDLRRFPKDAEEFYKGKTVRVRGKVALYKGRPEMVVRTPEAITVVK